MAASSLRRRSGSGAAAAAGALPTVAVATMVRWEYPFLYEWLAYYTEVVRVDRIYLFDDGHTPPLTENSALQKLGERVVVLPTRRPEWVAAAVQARRAGIEKPCIAMVGSGPQDATYNWFLNEYRPAEDWVAFFDADEYLAPVAPNPDGRVLQRALRHVHVVSPTAGAMAVFWRVFGSGGHTTMPTGQLPVQAFTKRVPDNHKLSSCRKLVVHVATFRAQERYFFRGPHTLQRHDDTSFEVDVNGAPSSVGQWPPPNHVNRVCLYHYMLRHKEWVRDVLCRRGRAMTGGGSKDATRRQQLLQSMIDCCQKVHDDSLASPNVTLQLCRALRAFAPPDVLELWGIRSDAPGDDEHVY